MSGECTAWERTTRSLIGLKVRKTDGDELEENLTVNIRDPRVEKRMVSVTSLMDSRLEH